MNKRMKELAEQARLPACHASHPVALQRFAELVRQDERDKFWSALMSDLEHGVKSLNERASERFAKEYPALNREFAKDSEEQA